MKIEGKTMLVAALLVLSAFMLVNKLLLPTTVQIMVQDGSTTLKEIPNLYTIKDCLIIAASSFLLGISIFYLLFIKPEPDMHADRATAETFDHTVTYPAVPDSDLEIGSEKIENILNILKGNEQRVIKELNDSGEMNQAELAARIGIPKSTLSRTLQDLERRKLIIRYENGMSKMVKLADSLKNKNQGN
ncbi:MAG: helix-turn-helix domain-containing protein [Euryarchaeota archaeon]|nr:helix-turn-helix domain-containing protein [Euryarchaeota archaeon]